jgi:hypothetical protein
VTPSVPHLRSRFPLYFFLYSFIDYTKNKNLLLDASHTCSTTTSNPNRSRTPSPFASMIQILCYETILQGNSTYRKVSNADLSSSFHIFTSPPCLPNPHLPHLLPHLLTSPLQTSTFRKSGYPVPDRTSTICPPNYVQVRHC